MRNCLTITCLVVTLSASARSQARGTDNPGCLDKSAQQCVALAMEAMGGRGNLEKITSMRLQTVRDTKLVEQSYRQAPFLTSYESDLVTLDFTNKRMRSESKITWPENDMNQPDLETTLIVGFDGGVYRGKEADSPCGLGDLDAARQRLELGPSRVLLMAFGAPDLHFEASEAIRGSRHTAVGFTWRKTLVRVLLNPYNHLPDAVETTQQFHDFWYYWGDVSQRIYYDNFKLVDGLTFPTNLVEERNGVMWSSEQVLNVEFNISVDDRAFAMDAKVAKMASERPPGSLSFSPKSDTMLASGIDLFPGPYNSTIVKEPDGIVILEAPISDLYAQGLIEEAKKRYPGSPIIAVLSTSDSWPHLGGVRTAVAEGLPIFILDLNQQLLHQLAGAPHTLNPDRLEKTNNMKPVWRVVSKLQEIGSGPNRMVLYPIRGAATERQYMVYFPEQRLLYASDTLALNQDGSLYDPELMYEVSLAVKRERLSVDKVFAMHQPPVEWSHVIELVRKAQKNSWATTDRTN
jgi:hypothetical protein